MTTLNTKKKRIRYPQDNPNWFANNSVHHPMDDELVKRIFRENKRTDDGKYDACWFMDPALDMKRKQYHLEWSENDVVTLWTRIIEHSMDVLRYSREDYPEYKEAAEFINSVLFERVCQALDLDTEILRKGVANAMTTKYGKNFDPAKCVLPESFSSVVATMSQGEENLFIENNI